uniref:Uncharacterized protein n=1 Tax=Glossina morsitans morsitans TaxID=37546 RepID=A0A1B0GCE7_GLOMM
MRFQAKQLLYFIFQ